MPEVIHGKHNFRKRNAEAKDKIEPANEVGIGAGFGHRFYVRMERAGLGLPSGFTKKTREGGYNIYPIMTDQPLYSGPRLFILNQFKELNVGREKNIMYFSYNNEIYYIESRDYDCFVPMNIYKKTDNTLIGTMPSNTNRTGGWSSNRNNYCFFDDQYIYYINKVDAERYELPVILGPDGLLSVTYNGIVPAPTTYWKDTVYRFDLETGENEKISLGLFIEMINKYDETVMKNPNYKGNLK